MLWLQTIGVFLLATAGWGLGRWFSKLKKPVWVLGYALLLVVLAFIGLSCYLPALESAAVFSWITAGRTEFALIAPPCAMLLTTPLSRLHRKTTKWLVYALLLVVVAYFAVLPFLLPAVMHDELIGLETVVDRNGVCQQRNGYTCGPAAAVTALRSIGLPAKEGELAVLAHTNPISGTPPDSLCNAIRKRYAGYGFGCEYRQFDSLTAFRGLEPAVAPVKHSFLVGHYVTVLKVSDSTITIGDPLAGLREIDHEEFNRMWRRRGLVLTGGAGM